MLQLGAMSNRLSATIQSIMDAKGYSARELARMLGWSPSTLSKKLNGELKIKRADREEIAAVLGTTADAIDQLAGVAGHGRRPDRRLEADGVRFLYDS